MKFFLFILLTVLVNGCGQNKTSSVNPALKKRQLKERLIDRNTLTIGFILDSLIQAYDSAYARGPIESYNVVSSNSFSGVLKGKKGQESSAYQWKFYAEKEGKDHVDVIYPGCDQRSLSLRFYSDSIYVFTANDAAFFIDLKNELYLCFVPEAKGRLPSSGGNLCFFILDDDLFPISSCYAEQGGSDAIRLLTKVTRSEQGSLSYKIHNSSLLNLSYSKLNYKNIMQLKKEAANSTIILNGEPSNLNPHNCYGPIWLNWS
ncbi:MAG: hypothetical protein K0S33_1590 [Bacteroidetes bacterium]|jgi:hypothetical protein|nr:hypothetical protein [Bacteroidota bacterium]